MDIKIEIDDERHFADVAPIVDREDFAREVERIRSALRLKIPLSNDYLLKPLDEDEEMMIDAEVEKSRKTLLLPSVFKSVICSVVFRNEVTNIDYSPAYLVHESENFYDADGEPTPDETYSIVLSPGVRDKDVLKALWKYRDELGNIQGVSEYKYIHSVWEVNKNKPSLRKYRDWYQTIENKGTYADIATEETKNCTMPDEHKTGKKKLKGCTCYDESTIRKGVTTYKSLIWKTPTF